MYVMVDLFAGDMTASAAMRDRGWDVRSVDIRWGEDVLKWEWRGGRVDLLWASPPCETFSIAGHFKHFRKDGETAHPIDEAGKHSVSMVTRAFELQKDIQPTWFVLENPQGLLRKIIGPPTDTTWYCQFGDERAKPTDLWLLPKTGPPGFLPLPKCRNGSKNHASAPRGAKTGTQGREMNARSHIPYGLSLRLAEAIEQAASMGER